MTKKGAFSICEAQKSFIKLKIELLDCCAAAQEGLPSKSHVAHLAACPAETQVQNRGTRSR